MSTIRRFKRPKFEGCRAKSPWAHDAIAWTCRKCGKKLCATCAWRFGQNRSPVHLFARDGQTHERLCTCSKCASDEAERAQRARWGK